MDTKYRKVHWVEVEVEVEVEDVVFLHYPTNLLILEEGG
jgi:hypothetical protein